MRGRFEVDRVRSKIQPFSSMRIVAGPLDGESAGSARVVVADRTVGATSRRMAFIPQANQFSLLAIIPNLRLQSECLFSPLCTSLLGCAPYYFLRIYPGLWPVS